MNTEFQLILYPVEPDFEIDLGDLKKHLDELKLLGKKLETLHGTEHYAVGDNFLSHFTFMGCSPDIELEPQTDQPFCYIALERFLQPHFVSGSNLKKTRCTHCKNDLITIPHSLLCPHCDQPLQLNKINWRKSAFIAKTWITVGNIYELEAIPNDELLDNLEQLTGVQWKPAYIRNATLIEV